MQTTCKNCGHPVQRIFWFFWAHVDEVGQLTKKCWETSDCQCPYPEPELQFKFKVHKITTSKGEYDFDKNILKLKKGKNE